MESNLFQPIYDTLNMFFPSAFFTNPFFSFLIDILYLCFGISLCYLLFICPIKFMVKAFKGKWC